MADSENHAAEAFHHEHAYDPTEGPNVWPECSECSTAYVLRRCISWTKGMIWCYQADCKCGKRKKPAPAPHRVAQREVACTIGDQATTADGGL